MLFEKTEVVRPSTARKSANIQPAAILSQIELLMVLDPSPELGEDKYLELYQKLVRYFGWNGRSDPEDLAQETLKRGLNRLQQGQKITAQNPESYFFGVARNLLREGWHAHADAPLEDHRPNVVPLYFNLNQAEQAVFLSQCLRYIPEKDLGMLIAYTQGDGEAWALKMGLRPTTLRSRIHRIRKRLEVFAVRNASNIHSSRK